MGQYTTAHFDLTGRILGSTVKHQKAAVDFHRKHGGDVAMKAWKSYLQVYPQEVVAWNDDGGEEFRKWPLQHFLDSGAAEDYVQAIYSEIAMESRSLTPEQASSQR
jgi:hypothetical protein